MTQRHTARTLLPLLGTLGVVGVNPAHAGLVASYSFETSDATDTSGGFDGVEVGSVDYSAGLCGQAASLNGAGAYIEIPSQPLGDFTVSAWFNQSADTGSWRRVWDFAGGGGFFVAAGHGRLGNQLGLGIHASNGAGVEDVGSGIYPVSGGWYHVAVSYDVEGGGSTLYVDGTEVGSGSYAAQSFEDFTTQRWYLGHSNWADPDFAGLIDEVRIYDTALDADAAAGLYAEFSSCDADGDGVPDVEDACPGADASGADGNGDGCPDDADLDGVPDNMDQCAGYDDALDIDGDDRIDGCEVDFDTSAVTVTVSGSVPATCYDSDGNAYLDELPVTLTVDFPEGLGHASYWESSYGAYAMWNAGWVLSLGGTSNSGTFDVNDYYNSWYHGRDSYYGSYVSGVLSRDNLYLSLSTYDDALFDDVRDHLAPAVSHLDGFEIYGEATNAAADACSVSWYGYGPTWGYTDLDGFSFGVTGDEDSDGVGDDADPCTGFPNVDSDGDEVCDASDRCPTDAADTDDDNDDVCDVDDLCVGAANLDADGDQVCDDLDLCVGNDATGDDDFDGYCVSADNCPGDTNADQADADDDGVGDACELDGDRDGFIDDTDNCPETANADQSDLDVDLQGDACDMDDDGDAVTDATDNCPFYPNTSQIDLDHDGYGDACDGEDDGDGVSDAADACPGTPLAALFDARGCSGEQRVELECGTPDDYGWTKRGKYTACVTKEATSAYRAGLLTGREKGLLVARSMVEVWISFVSVLLRWS